MDKSSEMNPANTSARVELDDNLKQLVQVRIKNGRDEGIISEVFFLDLLSELNLREDEESLSFCRNCTQEILYTEGPSREAYDFLLEKLQNKAISSQQTPYWILENDHFIYCLSYELKMIDPAIVYADDSYFKEFIRSAIERTEVREIDQQLVLLEDMKIACCLQDDKILIFKAMVEEELRTNLLCGLNFNNVTDMFRDVPLIDQYLERYLNLAFSPSQILFHMKKELGLQIESVESFAGFLKDQFDNILDIHELFSNEIQIIALITFLKDKEPIRDKETLKYYTEIYLLALENSFRNKCGAIEEIDERLDEKYQDFLGYMVEIEKIPERLSKQILLYILKHQDEVLSKRCLYQIQNLLGAEYKSIRAIYEFTHEFLNHIREGANDEIPGLRIPEKNPEVVIPEINSEAEEPEINLEFRTSEINPEVRVSEINSEVSVPEIDPQFRNPEINSQVRFPEMSPDIGNPEINPQVRFPEMNPEELGNYSKTNNQMEIDKSIFKESNRQQNIGASQIHEYEEKKEISSSNNQIFTIEEAKEVPVSRNIEAENQALKKYRDQLKEQLSKMEEEERLNKPQIVSEDLGPRLEYYKEYLAQRENKRRFHEAMNNLENRKEIAKIKHDQIHTFNNLYRYKESSEDKVFRQCGKIDRNLERLNKNLHENERVKKSIHFVNNPPMKIYPEEPKNKDAQILLIFALSFIVFISIYYDCTKWIVDFK